MKMKFSTTLLMVSILNGFIGCSNLKTAVHPDWLNQRSRRIAVLPFNGDTQLGGQLADSLVTELINQGFTVVERSEVEKIMREHKLEYSGAFNPLTLAETGRLSGVDFIVLGSVSTRPVTSALEYFLGDGEEHDQLDSVNIRWIGVQTGEVMASTRFRNGRGGKVENAAHVIAGSFVHAAQTTEQNVQARTASAPDTKTAPQYAYKY